MKMSETKTKRKRTGVAALRSKLISAAAMLLVAAIMMVSTSYAWYVMSTAPEVTGITTSVGANGALEIALLDAKSWNDLSLLDMGDIDESDTTGTVTSNLTWGNLVNLQDSSYGLTNVTLQPSRLYIESDVTGTSGTEKYKVNQQTLLKIPVYGEDGRVKELNKTSAITSTYNVETNSFDVSGGYGVRAVGTSSTMGVFQLGMNAARSQIASYMSAARKAASNALNDNGGELASIVLDKYLNKKDSFDISKVKAIRSMAVGYQNALDNIEQALRYAFVGYLTTTEAASDGITADNYQEKLNEITGENRLTLDELMTSYSNIEQLIPKMQNYITQLKSDQTAVNKAITDCDEKINLAATPVSWDDINLIIRPLVVMDKMTIAGMTVEEIQKEATGGNEAMNALAGKILSSGSITVTVPSGSGLLSNVADFTGDYTASITLKNISAAGFTVAEMPAGMTTQTNENPPYLTACTNGLRSGTVAEAGQSNGITDYYGYAIDLAFRTNATESNLLLQTEAKNRVYDGDSQNAALQGGGSYMSFTPEEGFSATKMLKLMSGVRVVFMDKDQNILAIAAPDCTLGQDVYKKEIVKTTEKDKDGNETTTEIETGNYYLVNGTGKYKNSDVITKEEYDALPATSSVTFVNGTLQAKLYLYKFSMTVSTATTTVTPTVEDGVQTQDEAGGDNTTDETPKTEVKYTGGITLGEKITGAEAAITALTQDEAQIVTALVYLDGSVVNNSAVAATMAKSVTATLNLQFSSSAALLPAENSDLRQGETTTEKKEDDEPQENTGENTSGT